VTVALPSSRVAPVSVTPSWKAWLACSSSSAPAAMRMCEPDACVVLPASRSVPASTSNRPWLRSVWAKVVTLAAVLR
jgi:hypothetical protein